MDPGLVIEAWKVGGIAAALLLVLLLVIWAVWKDGQKRETRLVTAIKASQAETAECREKHTEVAVSYATLAANNTLAMQALCAVLRERPCLMDKTPPLGTPIPH